MTSSPLLRNVHIGAEAPGPVDGVCLVKGDYEYWHYCCDETDDRGWGCGYRTLQTLCSWVRIQHLNRPSYHPPSSSNCQSSITKMNDISDDVGITVVESGEAESTLNKSKENFGISVVSSGDHSSDHHADADVSFSDNPNRTGSSNAIASVSTTKHDDVDRHGVDGLKTLNDGSKTSKNISCSAAAMVSPSEVSDVPSLPKVQQALVAMGDKPSSFIGSRQWIGSYEVCLCLDYFYNVPCKIVHIQQGSQLGEHLQTLHQHFSTYGSPVMMGGDSDASSKGIMGVCLHPPALLVVDPHYTGNTDKASTLQSAGWVKWILVKDFHQTSFYNLCLPQLTAQ